jgi:hypothetical protein
MGHPSGSWLSCALRFEDIYIYIYFEARFRCGEGKVEAGR